MTMLWMCAPDTTTKAVAIRGFGETFEKSGRLFLGILLFHAIEQGVGSVRGDRQGALHTPRLRGAE